MAGQRTWRKSEQKRFCLRLAAILWPVILIGLLSAPVASAAGSTADSAGTRQVSPALGPQAPAASALLKYKVGATGVTITDCAESATEIAIPAYLAGKPVTAIGYSAFSNCTSLTSIALPSTLKVIGDSAFVNCSALKTIALPEGLTQLGEEAFLNCTSLSAINISASLESFSGNAFANCPKIRFSLAGMNPSYILQEGVIYTKDQKTLVVAGATDSPSLVLPDTVTEVGDGAFQNKSLTAITLGPQVTTIGKEAFSGCSQLEEVHLNEGLTTIDDSAFAGTSALKTLELPGSLASLGITVFQGSGLETINLAGTQLITLPLGTFWDCLRLQDIVLGDKITAIEKGAFQDCTFKTITLPAQLRSLGGCFINCPNLETLTVPYSVRELGSSIFPNCTSLKTIYFEGNMPLRGDTPDDERDSFLRTNDSFAQLPLETAEKLKVYVLQGAKGWGDSFKDYVDGYAMGTTKRIDFEYKVNYYALPENEAPRLILHPPESLAALEAGSVAEAIEVVKAGMPKDAGPAEWSSSDSGVATVDSAGRVTAVAEGASQITAVLTYRGAVYTTATEVNVSAAAASADESIFAWSRQSDGTVIINGFRDGLDKAQMADLEIPETIAGYRVAAIKDFAFKGNLHIVSVTIPGSVKTVGAGAFCGCLTLCNVTLGDGIETIGDSAFAATCIGMVDIPRSVTQLKDYAFKDCPKLESATVESGNLDYSLGTGLFWNCTGLKNVSLAEGIKETGGLTFAGCSSLESVTLPSTLQALGSNDFSGCTSLKTLDLQSYLLKQDMREKPRAKDYSPFASLNVPSLGFDLPECNKDLVILHPDDGNDWALLFDNQIKTETWAEFRDSRQVGPPIHIPLNPLNPGPENPSPKALASVNSSQVFPAPAPDTASYAASPLELNIVSPKSEASEKKTDGSDQSKVTVFEIVKDAVAENPWLSLAAGAVILAIVLLGGIRRYRRYLQNQ